MAALAAAVGCGTRSSAKHLVGFSQCNLGEPWRVAMNADVAARARDFPDLEIVFADAQQDNAKQVADVENFLRQRIDLLMISPNEAKPLTPDRRAGVQGRHPGHRDRSRNRRRQLHDVHRGRQLRDRPRAGEHIVEILQGQGLDRGNPGLPGSPPAVDRSGGMHDAIAGHPGLQIIHSPVANWLREEAMAQMEMALAAHPAHRPRLRPQRPDGGRRVPGGESQGPRARDEVHRDRCAAGPGWRTAGSGRRQARRDLRVSDGRPRSG